VKERGSRKRTWLLPPLFCDVISILSVGTTLTSNASVASLKLTRILHFPNQVTVPKNSLRWVVGRAMVSAGSVKLLVKNFSRLSVSASK